jgi:predicted dehydrogenase
MDQEHSGKSRREFFGKVGAIGAGAFSIVRPEAVRGSQANSKVTFGLIGCGGRGTYDAGIVAKDERAQFTVLCDKFEDRTDNAKKELGAGSAAVYKDYEKALATDVDAVIIATPPFLHPPMLEAAVQAKKHIYCEKPMGVDVEGCKRVIQAGRKADPKKCIAVGFQQRYGPVYLEAYKRLQEGQIGELVNARGFWIGQDPFQRKPYDDPKVEKLRNWFCYKDYSGDFIVEQDCHNFDVLHWFLGGLPIRVAGYGGRKVRTTMDLLDHLSLTFEFPNGIHVNFEANQMTPPGYAHVGEEFTGTKGVLLTSRGSMTHIKGWKPEEREVMNSEADITVDAFKRFITRIKDGDVENVAERSALSTMIAILGRTALYTQKEVTWKGLYGA